MKSNMKLGLLGLLISALCVGACVGSVESQAPDEHVSEAQQKLLTCTSDCTGVPGASSITKTCNTSCTANSTQITCDGVTTQCAAQCAADYGQECQQKCICGPHPYYVYGTYDCTGFCNAADACGCCNGHPC